MYGFSTKVKTSFDETIDRVTEELKKEVFGVLTEIDVSATMKEKLGVERGPYKILGACNPSLAHQAIECEPDIGLLLPCNVVVRKEGHEPVTVAFMNPEAVLQLVAREEISALASEVRRRLVSVCNALD